MIEYCVRGFAGFRVASVLASIGIVLASIGVLLCGWVPVYAEDALRLQGGVLFHDVAVSAGVDYEQWAPSPKSPDYCSEVPRMTGGAAAGDFDGDGWVDLYVTRVDAPNLLFMNQGDGTFSESGALRGVDLSFKSNGCTVADVDNDGDLDLYVLAFKDRNFLYINDGNGFFVERSCLYGLAMELPGGASKCDGNSTGPAGEIDPALTHRNTSASFGDIDGDGDLDVHVLEWSGYQAYNRLFKQEANLFVDATVDAGALMSTVWGFSNGFADVDSDGMVDLLVAADFGTSCLYMNSGSGQFLDETRPAGVGMDENGMGSAIGDIDNDGDLDWFVTSIYDPDRTCDDQGCNWGNTGNRLYRNDGSGVFEDFTDGAGVRDGAWGWGASFLDYDNDGDLDLAMVNGMVFPCIPYEDPFNADVLRFWDNDGTGVMREVGAQVGFDDTGSGKGIVVFDYDRDGDEDIFITNNAGHPKLYRNDGGNAAHWLRVSLRGVASNRFGVGSRIYVTTPDGMQMREVSNNTNFLSQNEVIAHFGTGQNEMVDVRVDWPASGMSHVLHDVPTRATIEVVELRHGDCNGDDVVTLADFECFFRCAQGDGMDLPCYAVDFDLDGEVGLLDYGRFQTSYNP